MSRVLVGLVVLVGLQVPVAPVLSDLFGLAVIPAAEVLQHVVALQLLWSGRQQTAALVGIGVGVTMMAVILVPLGGIRGTAAIFVGLAGMLAVTWLEPRTAAVTVVVLVGLLIGTWWVGPPSEELRVFVPGADLRRSQMISTVLATTLVFGMVVASLHALHRTSDEARHRAEDAARATEVASRAGDAKARFLATMSHELRTPLNAILGYAGLLRDDAGPDGEDDVLEMARADHSPRPRRREDVDLRALVDARAATVPGCTVSRPAALVVDTDAGYVRRIVDVLLANAVRHTRDGRIAVELFRDTDEVRRDGGRGIPVSLLPYLFEPFVQAGTSSATDRTDLGVAFSQRLAQHLGGRVEVASTPGRGATFTVHLPTASA